MIDPRIVRVGVQVGDEINFYEGLSIYAKGTKFTSPNQGLCTITLLNIRRETRDYIMRIANPFNRNNERKSIILEVGRESYGTSVLYTGDIFRVQPTQKPDVGLVIRCVTGHFNKSNIVSRSSPSLTSLSSIATTVANDNNVALSFEVEDRNISNYQYTGSALAQVDKLSELIVGDVYIDSGVMYVKPANQPKTGATVRVLNKNTGMIGIPEGTENGIKTTMLYDPLTQIGSVLRLKSEIAPVLDGDYNIYKLNFDISSRDTQFYLNAEANRL